MAQPDFATLSIDMIEAPPTADVTGNAATLSSGVLKVSAHGRGVFVVSSQSRLDGHVTNEMSFALAHTKHGDLVVFVQSDVVHHVGQGEARVVGSVVIQPADFLQINERMNRFAEIVKHEIGGAG